MSERTKVIYGLDGLEGLSQTEADIRAKMDKLDYQRALLELQATGLSRSEAQFALYRKQRERNIALAEQIDGLLAELHSAGEKK